MCGLHPQVFRRGSRLKLRFLHAQREACEAYVLSQKHEGWEVVRIEYNDGGGNMDRPGLKRLLADIAAKRIDTVVVYKVDRLTRFPADLPRSWSSLTGRV